MAKYKNIAVRIISKLRTEFESHAAFCNIAEGTHAGSATMTADGAISSANLVLKASSDGKVAVASQTDKPLGVSLDQAASGDIVSVALPACVGNTVVCIAASSVSVGQSLYTAADGKVTATAANGSYKVGVALCAATSGGVVEIDPQGFGESAWQFYACGIHTWTGSTTSDSLSCTGLSDNDVVVASVQTAGGSEKTVKATASSTGISFTLDANGTGNSTKIAWIAIRKN